MHTYTYPGDAVAGAAGGADERSGSERARQHSADAPQQRVACRKVSPARCCRHAWYLTCLLVLTDLRTSTKGLALPVQKSLLYQHNSARLPSCGWRARAWRTFIIIIIIISCNQSVAERL